MFGRISALSRKKLVLLTAWLTAIAGIAAILAIATSGAAPSQPLGAQNGAPVRVPPASAGHADPPDPGAAAAAVAPRGPPAASPADAAATRAVLGGDATLARILQGIPYRVTSISPWTDAAGDGVLGTAVDIQLDSPLTATTELPGVRFDPDGITYRQLTIPVHVTAATTFRLLVDVDARQVVSAMPPDATLSPTPDTHGLYRAPGDAHGS